jgi:hypothetical protein
MEGILGLPLQASWGEGPKRGRNICNFFIWFKLSSMVHYDLLLVIDSLGVADLLFVIHSLTVADVRFVMEGNREERKKSEEGMGLKRIHRIESESH